MSFDPAPLPAFGKSQTSELTPSAAGDRNRRRRAQEEIEGMGQGIGGGFAVGRVWSIFADHVYALRMLKPRAMRRLIVTCREYSAFRQKHMLAIDWYS
jgi:hypothetical protein